MDTKINNPFKKDYTLEWDDMIQLYLKHEDVIKKEIAKDWKQLDEIQSKVDERQRISEKASKIKDIIKSELDELQEEFSKTSKAKLDDIKYLEELKNKVTAYHTKMSGKTQLNDYDMQIIEGMVAKFANAEIYKEAKVTERFKHIFELQKLYLDSFKANQIIREDIQKLYESAATDIIKDMKKETKEKEQILQNLHKALVLKLQERTKIFS